MSLNVVRYSYGPVPSRRLGKSLGINNIPAKVCTYSCIYCQAGRTTQMTVNRRCFYDPHDIFQDVRKRVEAAKESTEQVDYLTFVPDGEPTLDLNLGKEIMLLRTLGIPIGVITNGSLVTRDDVREELANADWVSLKVDAVQDRIWHQINRPHKTLRLSSILTGMLQFARSFAGTLVTETMLVNGINDTDDSVNDVAGFLRRLEPYTAYLSIPIRPPTDRSVRAPDEGTLNRAHQIFAENVQRVEDLVGYEGESFAFTGDVEKDLLSITAVHPMRQEAVEAFLSRARAPWSVVNRLVAQGHLVATEYEGHLFYLRKFSQDCGVTTWY